ncbi:YcxB family protein [Oscillospiraceae bacterium MB08-C2-2]|nr:YcxB family protein [Oscillospiraceae bacterium MB08-C2-2]
MSDKQQDMEQRPPEGTEDSQQALGVTLSYPVDAKLYGKACQMLDKHSGAFRKRDLILCFIAVFLAESFWSWMVTKDQYEKLASAGVMLVAGVLVYFMPIWRNKREVGVLLAEGENMTLTVSPQEIQSFCGKTKSSLNFDHETTVLEDKQLFYIEQKKGERYYVPKALFKEKQLDELRAIVKSRASVTYTYIEGSEKNRRG